MKTLCLQARATYTDDILTLDSNDDDNPEMASESTDGVVRADESANFAPLFPDQDFNTVGRPVGRDKPVDSRGRRKRGRHRSAGDGQG